MPVLVRVAEAGRQVGRRAGGQAGRQAGREGGKQERERVNAGSHIVLYTFRDLTVEYEFDQLIVRCLQKLHCSTRETVSVLL